MAKLKVTRADGTESTHDLTPAIEYDNSGSGEDIGYQYYDCNGILIVDKALDGERWDKALGAVKAGKFTPEQIKEMYNLTKEQEAQL